MLKSLVEEEAQPAEGGDGRLAEYLAAAHRLRKAQLAVAGEPPAAAEPADDSQPATDAAAPAAPVPSAPTGRAAAAPAHAAAPAAAQSPAPAPTDPPADSCRVDAAGEQAAAQPAAAQPASKRRKVRILLQYCDSGLSTITRMSLPCPAASVVRCQLQCVEDVVLPGPSPYCAAAGESQAASGACDARGGLLPDPPPPLQQVWPIQRHTVPTA